MTDQSNTTITLIPNDTAWMSHVRSDTDASSTKPRAHLDFIDGLRGLALSMVLLFHFWQNAHCPFGFWWDPLQLGYSGVNLFLLLSGFCLYWPLVRPGRPAPEPSLLQFARRRAHRLLPPYYATLALFTSVALIWHAHDWAWADMETGGTRIILTSAVWHALMLHNLRPEYLWTIDGPLWSLALEVHLYVAMPLLVVMARKWGIGRAVVVAALVTVAYRLWVNAYVGGAEAWIAMQAGNAYVLSCFLPGRWLEFALGMWAATLVSRNMLEGSRLPLGFFALLCFGTALYLRAISQEGPFTDIVLGLTFFFFLLQVSQTPNDNRFSLSHVLRWKPLVWLGTISYSVYLLHEPLLKLFLVATGFSHMRDGIVMSVCLFLFLPILIGVSYGFYLLVEKPFLNTKPQRAPDESASFANKGANRKSKLMNIAITSLYLPSGSKIGVGYQVHALANALMRRGHHVTVFSQSGASPDSQYEVVVVPSGSRLRTFGFAWGLRQQDLSRFDVLNAHGDDWFLWRRKRPRHIHTFHGSCLAEALHAKGFTAKARMAALAVCEYSAAILADDMVTVSANTRRYLPFIKRVIPCGVDLEKFHPGPESEKSSAPSLLFVGTMHGRKRGAMLLDLFQKQILPQVPDAEFWAVCENPIEGPGVRWFGRIPEDQLTDLYRRAWAFCLPSTYEGFGVPYIEAMASGTLVIASPNVGAREVTQDGKYGLIVEDKDLAQALVQVLTDSALRTRLREAGLERAQDFGWDRICTQYEVLFEGDKTSPVTLAVS